MHLKILKNTHKEANSMTWKRERVWCGGNPFLSNPPADFKVLERNLTNL